MSHMNSSMITLIEQLNHALSNKKTIKHKRTTTTHTYTRVFIRYAVMYIYIKDHKFAMFDGDRFGSRTN